MVRFMLLRATSTPDMQPFSEHMTVRRAGRLVEGISLTGRIMRGRSFTTRLIFRLKSYRVRPCRLVPGRRRHLPF